MAFNQQSKNQVMTGKEELEVAKQSLIHMATELSKGTTRFKELKKNSFQQRAEKKELDAKNRDTDRKLRRIAKQMAGMNFSDVRDEDIPPSVTALVVERTNLNATMAANITLTRKATKLLAKTEKRMIALLDKGCKIRDNVKKIVMDWQEKVEKLGDKRDFDIQDVTKMVRYASTMLLEDADAHRNIQ